MIIIVTITGYLATRLVTCDNIADMENPDLRYNSLVSTIGQHYSVMKYLDYIFLQLQFILALDDSGLVITTGMSSHEYQM